MREKFEDIDYWKAIVLYGLNQATYKIALGKALLQFSQQNKTVVEWEELSKVFLSIYIDRLKSNLLPQQNNPSRRTVMERIVDSLNKELITYSDAIESVGIGAFNDVIPRFQTIGADKNIVGQLFYHFDHGKKLFLHDAIFKINETNRQELVDELDARWGLLEGAFSMVHGDFKLINSNREIYITNGYDRKALTSTIPFLQGYQGNICFYCGEKIESNEMHVDHLIPRQVLQHDEIWNLVLSHEICNLNKNDSLVGIHYVEKLIARNENIMGSNHPWKKKISDSLGATKIDRNRGILRHYENARIVLHNRYWENSPSYNREADMFFKRLITKLNNS